MSALQAKLGELEKSLGIQQRQLDVLEASIESAKRNRQALEDVWGAADGKALAGKPLYAAIVAVIASNLALFTGFVVVLTGWSFGGWDAIYLICIAVAGFALPATGLPGAGGRARIGLRYVTFAFLALAVFEGIYAALRR